MALPPVNPEPRGSAVAPLVWAAVVLAFSRSDTCVRVLPVLEVLRGPAGILLAAVAAALVLAARLPSP
ncbi:MAG TPA: hypothetical protein VFK70_07595, partial [Vicinamibacteria bacterium]|nr:hypothetical protein [Vicinamibacteria bacterium]